MAPGLPEIAQKYNITSETIISMVLSIFLLTFAFGPLFLAPLSEIYGRTWVRILSRCRTLTYLLTILSDPAYWKPSVPGVQPCLCIRAKYRCLARNAFDMCVWYAFPNPGSRLTLSKVVSLAVHP